MSGIGGDGFIMTYRAHDPVTGHDSLRVCNGTGAAPYAATLGRYRNGIPMKGILSVSVPGILNAWLDVHGAYGSLPLSDVLAPAIALADDGFPVTHYLASAIAGDSLLCEFPTSRAIFTRNGSGEPLRAGDILRQADLARTPFRHRRARSRRFLPGRHRRGHRPFQPGAGRLAHHGRPQ